MTYKKYIFKYERSIVARSKQEAEDIINLELEMGDFGSAQLEEGDFKFDRITKASKKDIKSCKEYNDKLDAEIRAEKLKCIMCKKSNKNCKCEIPDDDFHFIEVQK